MKKIKLITTIALLSLVFSACSMTTEMTDDTHISIDKNGAVNSHIKESFGEAYYNIDELKESINKSLEEYKAIGLSDGDVKLSDAALSDGDVVIDMTYASGRDFENFDGYTFFAGKVADAVAQNYPLHTVLIDVEDSTTTISEADIKAMENSNILITDYEDLIYLPSKIIYASDNCTIKDNSVKANDGSTGLIYVIYK